jgi:peroxiredoxin
MALTPSNMLSLGTRAPDFRLPAPAEGGRLYALADFHGADALVVMFICNHCPYVKHLRTGLAEFGRFCHDLSPAGKVAVVAINSNDVATHPQDGPAAMAQESQAAGYVFPYLFDETQAVAKAYQAACTPDFYLFDRDQRLVYRGQFDDSRPGNSIPVTGESLRDAIKLLISGTKIPEAQKPSIGCNIKWKAG